MAKMTEARVQAGKRIGRAFMDKKVGVLMGGVSSEREISLRTGASVLRALSDEGYDAVSIDAGTDLFTRLREEGVELAFIALHGGWGEDGSLQGGLEVMGIPYTGSGVLASAIAMDKIITKRVLLMNSIPTPAFSTSCSVEDVAGMRFPLVVKPSEGGSTLGLSLVGGPGEFRSAVDFARGFGGQVLVEEYIEGREVSVSIFDGSVFPVVEILIDGPLYDYEAKYSKGGARFSVPADLPETLNKEVSSIAKKAYEALGCRGAARVDIILDNENRPFVLEVNTSPGLTERSLLPMAAQEAGLSYRELVARMLEGASLEHGHDKEGCK